MKSFCKGKVKNDGIFIQASCLSTMSKIEKNLLYVLKAEKSQMGKARVDPEFLKDRTASLIIISIGYLHPKTPGEKCRSKAHTSTGAPS